jgi:hypothetical protein
MPELTPEGQKIIAELAQRHGFSVEAVTTMLHAVAAGGGGMAQFEHPEFGGMGQWTSGGMTMVGDMFNNALKARVDALCTELAGIVSRQPRAYAAGSQLQRQSQGGFGGGFSDSLGGGHAASLFVAGAGGASGGWWPEGLGRPTSTGQQNNIRYAVFPAARRLVIDIGGRVSVYDTLDHHIGGVSQQQSGDASLTFTSQHGLVRVADLPVVCAEARAPERGPAEQARSPEVKSPRVTAAEAPTAAAPTEAPTAAAPTGAPSRQSLPDTGSSDDIFAKLERLAGLREKGILSEEEFAAKKTELLARL